jgi:hypothetical protein
LLLDVCNNRWHEENIAHLLAKRPIIFRAEEEKAVSISDLWNGQISGAYIFDTGKIAFITRRILGSGAMQAKSSFFIPTLP